MPSPTSRLHQTTTGQPATPSAAFPSRDVRLDFLRGYFLVIITINHLALAQNEWVRPFTGLNQLWVSAAAGFVLVSGAVIGQIYPHRIAQYGLHAMLVKGLRRALHLYLLTVIGQIIMASGDFILYHWRGRPTGVPLNYYKLIEGAVLQNGYTYWYIDLLPLYAVLLPAGIVIIWAVQRGYLRWVLLGSVAVWAMRLTDINTMRLLGNGFQPASWQILFVAALLAGYYRPQIRQVWQQAGRWRPWLAAALVTAAAGLLVVSYQVAFHGWWADTAWLQSSSLLFDKGRVGVGRLAVALVVMAGLYTAVTAAWRPLHRGLGWLLLPLGQNALTAYILQGILAYIVTRLPGWPFGDLSQPIKAGLSITAVLLVWQLTRLLAALYTTLPARKWRLRPLRSRPTQSAT